jgi:hypothetical protein
MTTAVRQFTRSQRTPRTVSPRPSGRGRDRCTHMSRPAVERPQSASRTVTSRYGQSVDRTAVAFWLVLIFACWILR